MSDPDAAPESTAFRAKDLTKVYGEGHSAVHALSGVDIEIRKGEIIVLLGPSGSGKSTLLNILGGLDRPTAGQVWFDNECLTDMSDRELTEYRRDHLGFVFQFYNLIPSLTARENVSLVSDIAPDPMPADVALELVGLQDRLDHFPAQLSGGEQQRVAIARAVAKQPELLLCDEPTGALDAETGKLVLRVLDKVNRETGITMAIITHNVAIAAIGDRVVRMSSGEIHYIEENAVRASIDDVEW